MTTDGRGTIPTIHLKRAYDPPSPEDGERILVERLWPRGVSKAELVLDDWAKAIAPSPELRRWYAHDLARWSEFQRRYRDELAANRGEVDRLLAAVRRGPVTLIFGSKDREHCSALVLKQVLEERLR